MIAGNFNAKSFLLGSDTLDQGGKIFDKLIDELHFIPLNTGAGNHLTHLGKLSPIDVTLAFTRLAVKASWEVLEDNLGSDHMLIKITLSFTSITETLFLLRLILKNG